MLPFNIGFGEVLLILIVVLLVVGPNKLPDIAKTMGKGIRTVRKAGRDLRDAMDVDEIKRSVYDVDWDRFDEPPVDAKAESIKSIREYDATRAAEAEEGGVPDEAAAEVAAEAEVPDADEVAEVAEAPESTAAEAADDPEPGADGRDQPT